MALCHGSLNARFPGSLVSTFPRLHPLRPVDLKGLAGSKVYEAEPRRFNLEGLRGSADRMRVASAECLLFFSSLLLSSLELSDTKVYEPEIRARLGTAAYFCEVAVLSLIS